MNPARIFPGNASAITVRCGFDAGDHRQIVIEFDSRVLSSFMTKFLVD